MDLPGAVERYITNHALLDPGDAVVIGVSGGGDSLCLLHILLRLAPHHGWRVLAAHLHHGIRGDEADGDAAHVRAVCGDWGVTLFEEACDVPALARERRLSLEETARQERYAFLGQVARQEGAAATAVAHHADDQVETVLMHLLRGSGLAGLRGMLPSISLTELHLGHPGDEAPPNEEATGPRLIRPLLATERRQIEAYCAREGIESRFDRSNLDTTYLRNRIRHELIPTLESYNPNIRRVLQHTAEAIAGDYELIFGELLRTWEQVVLVETHEAAVFALGKARGLPPALQRSLLREGVRRLRSHLRNINWVHIDDAVAVLRLGTTGAQATLPGGLALTLGYDRCWIAAPDWTPDGEAPVVQAAVSVSLPGCVALGGGWTLTTELMRRAELGQAWRDNAAPLVVYLDADRLRQPLMLRPRRSGDVFHPLGLGHRQSLRHFMVNAKVPATQRETLPLLVCGDEIAWVVGWRLDQRFAITDDTCKVAVFRMTHETQARSDS